MVISYYPSMVRIPDGVNQKLIIDFLCDRFKKIDREKWSFRFEKKLILDKDKNPVDISALTDSHNIIYYYKVVDSEPSIPFKEKIVYENERFLIACKPHFLPVIPTGPYLNECLLHRLKKRTANPFLIPANRIDRDTAGLVLFVKKEILRGRYQSLFIEGKIGKEYEAIVKIEKEIEKKEFSISKRLVKGEPFFRTKAALGEPNSLTEVNVMDENGEKAFLKLKPFTGKKHQLRVHLADYGLPILHDRYYPVLNNKPDNFEKPLQLLSKKLSFKDPVTGKDYFFSSERKLNELF